MVFIPFHQWGEGSCAAQVNAARLSFLWTVILFVPSSIFLSPWHQWEVLWQFYCQVSSSLKDFIVLTKRGRSKNPKPIAGSIPGKATVFHLHCNRTLTSVPDYLHLLICNNPLPTISHTLHKALNLALPSARLSSASPKLVDKNLSGSHPHQRYKENPWVISVQTPNLTVSVINEHQCEITQNVFWGLPVTRTWEAFTDFKKK